LRVRINDGKILRQTKILAHASDGADVLRALRRTEDESDVVQKCSPCWIG